MLNPDRGSITVPTLLLITTSLAAVAEGGYILTLCCYIHEEFGQKQWGSILGYILSAGALGLLAFDEGVLLATLRTFGQPGKKQMDAYGEQSVGMGMFTSYGSWVYVLFLATFLASFISLIFAVLGYCYTTDHKQHRKPKERQTIEMATF